MDGNTDGSFAAGSVTHTAADPNAWFEIDLGSVEPIDHVTVWNRTDCCPERLRHYWLFISENPFGKKDAAAALRVRKDTWSKFNFGTPQPAISIKTPGVRGRYVRIQLDGRQTPAESFLSLAEVQVFRAPLPVAPDTRPVQTPIVQFRTNRANYLRLDVQSPVPTQAEYLLSNNPRLHFFLNGKRVAPRDQDNSPLAIQLPSGHNLIEVRYRNWPLTVFWVFYALFGLACIVVVAGNVIRRARTSRPSRVTSTAIL